MNIAKFLREQGVEFFRAWDISTAFNAKYGNQLLTLASPEWVLDNVADVVNFDILKTTWNDSNYGEFPEWIKPAGKVDFVERKDNTGWKQCEWRGKFHFDGKKVDGTFVNHFHIDRQKDGTPIENIFWGQKS